MGRNSLISALAILSAVAIAIASCGNSQKKSNCDADIVREVVSLSDTLVNLELNLDFPGYVTTKQAYNSNTGITGRIGNWEERAKRMQVDTSYHSLLRHKVMKMDGEHGWWEISESPIALYNYDSPILYFPSSGLVDVPEGLDYQMDTSSVFCQISDCRFGQGRLKALFSKKQAIAMLDSLGGPGAIFFKQSEDGMKYSYITLCHLRGKIVMVSSIPEEELVNTEEGQYLLKCIGNYMYHGSEIDRMYMKYGCTDKEWFRLAGIEW